MCMNRHAEAQAVFLLIWGITRLLCPLYPQMKNVSSMHSCLEIPILKRLRCWRSNQMNKHISLRIPTSYTGLLLMRGKTFQFVIRRASVVNWGHKVCDHFLRRVWLKRHQSADTICTICAGCVSWHVWIQTFSCILICSHDAFRFSHHRLFSAVWWKCSTEPSA